ncbi:MAG: matrixin family metalloprotease [Candidatus Margulisiibacteriota bacterium]
MDEIIRKTFPQNLPVTFYIDEAFTEDEREEIIAAMEDWNIKASERLKDNQVTFIFGGLVPHVDFTYPLFVDGAHVVYKIYEPVPDVEWIRAKYDYNVAGYATKGDVLILCQVFFPEYIGSADAWKAYLRDVRRINVHEFGHNLGLSHFNHVPAVMNLHDDLAELTKNDLDEFCILYECE